MRKRGVTFAEKGGNICGMLNFKYLLLNKLQGIFFAYSLNSLNRLNKTEKKRSLGSIFFRLFFLMFEQFYSITGEDSLQHTEQEGQLPYSLRTTE